MRTRQPARRRPEWLSKLFGERVESETVLTPPAWSSSARTAAELADEKRRRGRFTLRPATRGHGGRLAGAHGRIAS